MTLRSSVLFVLRNAIVPIFGWRVWNVFVFFVTHKYIPNIRNPKKFLEFLLWSKYYGRVDALGGLVDKVQVKNFLKGQSTDFSLVPTMRVVHTAAEIDSEFLECRKWIAKASHASGYSLFGEDVSSLQEIRDFCRKCLRLDYVRRTGELNYRYAVPSVIFEPLICDREYNLIDYKFWCFNGKAHFIGVHGDRRTIARGQIFLMDRTPSKLVYPEIPDWSGREVPWPKDLYRMQKIAEQLSKGFRFVRVDLYEVNDVIYFGEYTFSPGDGLNIRIPSTVDLELGAFVRGNGVRKCFYDIDS